MKIIIELLYIILLLTGAVCLLNQEIECFAKTVCNTANPWPLSNIAVNILLSNCVLDRCSDDLSILLSFCVH